jgi:hypothetical protein
MSIPQALLRDEILRNVAYIEVRRSDLPWQMGVPRQPLNNSAIQIRDIRFRS